MTKNDLFGKAIRTELEYWPGVTVKFSARGRHREANFSFGKESRFIIVPSTSSDTVRGPKNCVRDMRGALRDMGALRRDAVPVSKREKEEETINMAEGASVRMGILADRITVTIPKTNPLYKRFASNKDKAISHWGLELRSNPDMKAEPFLAIVKRELPDGAKRLRGAVGGNYNSRTRSFQVTFLGNAISPVVEKFGHLKTSPVAVRDAGSELLVTLPKEREEPIPKVKIEEPAPEPVVEEVAEEVVAPPLQAPSIGSDILAELLSKLKPSSGHEKMTLQFPERPLTVERCVSYLNEKIRKKGKQNLRLHVDHDTGMLSYIEKGGPAH